MQNITELRKALTRNYAEMENGSMDLKLGSELCNVAGKIINSLKVELEYNSLMKNNKKIEFLENNQ